jgi:hypothetical protein
MPICNAIFNINNMLCRKRTIAAAAIAVAVAAVTSGEDYFCTKIEP